MIHRSGVAASFLRQQLPFVPREAKDYIESAATHYDRILALLTPALAEGTGVGYSDFIGRPDRQQAHASMVLQPIREHLVAAAGEFERAAAVM
jgi:hypothetical protein